MHFMFLILGFMLCLVVWGFFQANPRGAPPGRVLACNAAIVLLALAAVAASSIPLYADALAAKPDHKALAIYLAAMAGGAAFMIVMIVGGLVRNLAIFRPCAPATAQLSAPEGLDRV